MPELKRAWFVDQSPGRGSVVDADGGGGGGAAQSINFVNTASPTFSGTPSTGSYTAIGGPHAALVFGFLIATADVTGVTYGGQAMTLIGHKGAVAGNFIDMYYLLGPPDGAADFIVTSTAGSGVQYAGVCEYTGVRPTGQPDDTDTMTTPVVSNFTQFSASTEDNTWVVTYVNGTTINGYTAGANFTMRQAFQHGAMGDSGPRTPAGLNSYTVSNADAGTNWNGISITFAPG